MLVNMSGGYNVSAVRNSGSTTITVTAGNQVTADAEGVVIVTP